MTFVFYWCYMNKTDVFFCIFAFQSFHLQPTGTPGTYYLQTTSNQSLPLSLANNSTVTLTTGSSPSSHEHIILHSLSVSLIFLRRGFKLDRGSVSCVYVLSSSDWQPLLQRRRHHPDRFLWPRLFRCTQPIAAGCGDRGPEPGRRAGCHKSPGGFREGRNSGANDRRLHWQGINSDHLYFPLDLL